MAKNQKRIGIVIGVILAFALLIFLNSQFNFVSLPYSIAGTSTLSLQQAELQSSNSYLSGKVWMLTFRSGGLGQSYYGSFSPSDVDSATSDNSRTTKSFSISVDYSNQECIYPIQSTNQLTPIYDLVYKEWTCVFNPTEAQAKAGSGLQNVLYIGRYSLPDPLTCWAIGWNTQSSVGNFGETNLNSNFDISINVNGQIAKKSINTLSGSTSGMVGDYAYAIWQGNLVSGQSCPQTTDTLYRPIYINGRWSIGDKASYTAYYSKLYSEPTNNKNQVNVWMSNINELIRNAKISKSFGEIENAYSISNAVLKYTLSSQIQFPVTTLYIKADKIGIYTPTPDIRFVSGSSGCFQTGNTGSVSVTLKNYGENGNANIYGTCSSPFSITKNQEISLTNGESKSINLPISAYASSETTGTCVIYAEGTFGKKSINVETCVKPQITCTTPYPKLFCGYSGNLEAIFQCSSDGAIKTLINTCNSNEYCDAQTQTCKVGTTPGSVSIWTKIGNFFSNLFNSFNTFLNIIKGIVAVIILFATLIFSKGFIEEKLLTKKKQKILVWIFASLLTLLVASLLWILLFTFVFWLIIIGLGITLGILKYLGMR